MQELIENLQRVSVLRQEDIVALKNHIHEKNMMADSAAKADLLAETIHGIIEKKIDVFNPEHRISIRVAVLKKAVVTNNYNITGADLFKVCLYQETDTDEYMESFTKWVNTHQDVPVSKERLQELIFKVKQHDEGFPEGRQHTTILDKPKKAFSASLLPRVFRMFKRTLVAAAAIGTILFPSYLITVILPMLDPLNPAKAEPTQSVQKKLMDNTLPEDLQYKKIKEDDLKSYLIGKKSLLAEEPYFSAIISSAEEFNVNPLLLFAITGQEQNFVPKNHKYARAIANNPFNVFGSWQDYNTSIEDSSRIAARTVVNASSNRPLSADPIMWINRRYAEDKNWWIGVRRILENLEKAVDSY